MILSNGTNRYPNNEFSFWDWSAPVLQTPEEILQKLKELRLEGRVVKDIIAIGMGYEMCGDSLRDWARHVYKNMHPVLREQIPEEKLFAFPDVCVSRSTTLDEPLLIVFEDGDVLGILFDDGSSVRMELNTIPVTIEPGINRKNFHANRMFQDMIGKSIVGVAVTATTEEPDFAWSHGLDLEEQSSYVESVAIIYDDGTRGIRITEDSAFKRGLTTEK